jgi:hypothetical protein
MKNSDLIPAQRLLPLSLEEPREAWRLEGWVTGYMVRDGASAPPHHEV